VRIGSAEGAGTFCFSRTNSGRPQKTVIRTFPVERDQTFAFAHPLSFRWRVCSGKTQVHDNTRFRDTLHARSVFPLLPMQTHSFRQGTQAALEFRIRFTVCTIHNFHTSRDSNLGD